MSLLTLVVAVCGAAASADFALDRWRYAKSIELPAALPPEGLAEGLVELPVDREVFRHAAPQLVDLRVVRGEATEVPFQLVTERGRRGRESFPASIRDLRHVPGQYSSFVIDLGRNGILHNEVDIRTSSRNFQRQVTVEGSTDADTWAVLEDQARILDFSPSESDFTSRHTRVRYPNSTGRYLRVRIMNNGEEPLEIGGATVFSVTERPPEETAYAASILSRSGDPQRQATVMVIDLGTEGLPTSRLEVQASQTNFYRTVSLEGSKDADTWTPVRASGEIYSYDTPKFTGRQMSVTYPEVSLRYFRLTVHNQDNPPLDITEVDVYGITRKLLFPADAGASYLLYYGNPQAAEPAYDLGRFLPYLETEDLPEATLGPETRNPAFEVPQEPLSERLPWLIPLAVALTAAAVGLLLFGVVRQARKVLPPPG